MDDRNAKASELIIRFRSLNQHVETIVFPKTKNSIFMPVNMDAWNPVRRFLYKTSMPYLYTYEKSNSSIFYLFLTISGLIMSFYSLMIAERIAKAVSFELYQFQLALLWMFIFLCFFGMISFLFDARYHIILKIIVLLVVGIASLALGTNLFPLTLTDPPTRTITSFEALIQVFALVFSTLLAVAIFLINTFLSVLLSYVQLINFTETVQSPSTDKLIERLLSSEINSDGSLDQWRILDLPKKDIVALRSWSESNLNSSEKRTIPAVIILPLVAVLWGINEVRDFLLSPLFESTSISWKTLLASIVLMPVLLFITVFSKSMVSIFRNIAIQSLIIETTLVAEYAVEEPKELQVSEKGQLRTGFFNTIIKIIAKIISMN
jgi:hypothetical protein